MDAQFARTGIEDPRNTQALAHDYVSELQGIYPTGPIILVGYCEGAKLTAYAAKESQAEGREVVLLCTIEQFVPLVFFSRSHLVFP
ncbi:MAG: hypothetical protein HRT77_06190 [Halioglobus sp.]|nr:hypothetical protein [Halioglobus sp.]